MRSLIRCLALLCVCAFASLAQIYDTYSVSYTVSLSSAQTALSVQLPNIGSYGAEVLDSSVQCSAICSLRFEVNGLAATAINATSQPVRALNPDSTPAALVTSPNISAWSGTGIPAGTAVSPDWSLPAGALVPFGGGRILTAQNSISNYIMRIPSNYTGTVTMFFLVRVRR